LPSVAKYLKSDQCRNVFLMVGAGISTSAGIPDFRSPDTGLYANLARLNLPYPEAVFDISYFRKNPQPFYTLAAELYPGYYRPTPTHAFIRLLAEKHKLNICFSQNIDTLERIAGVPIDKIVEAHGSFATQRCIKCRAEFPDDQMITYVKKGRVPKCKRTGCDGLVKPDIVFFGEGLPDSFTEAVPQLSEADLLIIMGTSLTVYPFAGLRQMVPHSCPRVLINLDRVSDIGSRRDDVVLTMPCDDAVRSICKEIGGGWDEELERLWKGTENSYTPREPEVKEAEIKKDVKKPTHPGLEDHVEKLAKMVEEKMKLESKEDDGESPVPKANERSTDTEDPAQIHTPSVSEIRLSISETDKVKEDLDTPHYHGGQTSVPETEPPSSDAGGGKPISTSET